MATEKLKVFVNTASTVSTSAITNVAIKTTSSSEQAVLKTISYEATDPKYPVTASLTNGNASLTTPKTTAKTVKNSDTLAGSQIVDVSSTVNLTFDTGADITTPGYADVRYFAGNNTGIYRLHDSTSTDRVAGATLTYADSIGDFSGAQSGTLNQKANSAFGIILDSNNSPTSSPAVAAGDKVYFACFPPYVKAYNAAGALITWNSGGASNDAFQFASGIYGACTDGTYIYAKAAATDTTLYRRTIVGNVASQVTLNASIYGQTDNQGGFTLYHDGYIYLHQNGGASEISKVNVTTGAVTQITGCAVGSYSAGAILTKAVNGKFYIIECGTDANENNIIDLTTFTRLTPITMISLGVSTEYGNLGFEIQPGVGIFFYNDAGVFIDVNSMTASSSQFTQASFFGSGTPGDFSSNSDASSFANIPLHQIPGGTLARAVTHKVYADGVLIEGVA